MPTRRPYGSQGTGHAPTAAIRGLGDWLRFNGNHTGPRKPTMPSRWPYGTQGTGHTPTAAITGAENGHDPTAAIRGPGD